MSEILKFEIDKAKILHEASEGQLAILEVYVCHDGLNKHGMEISLDAIKLAVPTLLNKFLVAAFDGEDFEGHEPYEQIIGFFPKENNIRYETLENGKTYLVCNAILSKFYAPWAYEVFVDDGNYRSVSMEICVAEKFINERNVSEIKTFIFNGVTVLGTKIKPACELSNAKVIKFSDEDISNAEKVYIDFQNTSKEDELMKGKEKMAEIEIEVKPDGEMPEDKTCEKCGKVECVCQKDMSVDSIDYKVKCEGMEAKYSTLEAEKSALESKLSTIESELNAKKEVFATLEAENANLKEFKSNVEKQVRDNEVEFAIKEVSEDIGGTQLDEWRAKAGEFETVEAFSNAIKSFAYELTKNKKGKKKEELSRIMLPIGNANEKADDGDVWSKLKNKIK